MRQMALWDEERARNSWEDAWLEVAALTVRAECAARVVRRLEAGQPDGPHDRLAVLGAEWTASSHAMTVCLRRVGLRLRARAADPAPSYIVAPGGVANDRATRGPSRGGVTTLAAPAVALPRTRVATSPPGSLQPIAIHSASVAPPNAIPALVAPRERTPTASAVRASDARPPPERVKVPAATPTAAPIGRLPANGPTARHRLVVVIIVMLTLVAAGVAAATIARELGKPATVGDAFGGAAAGGSSPPSGASNEEASAGAVPPASAMSVTFDVETMGALGPGAAGVARVLGAPEVVALPTPFDRSLRLGAPGDGLCLTGPPGGRPARAVTFDLYAGAQPAADLRLVPVDRPDQGVTLALAEIPGLGPDAWYRVRVEWRGQRGAIHLDIRARDGGEAIESAELKPSSALDRGRTGSVCVEAARISDATAVHVDNVRAGT